MKLKLLLKAELVNVTDLQVPDEAEDLYFQVKCTSCQEVHANWVSMNRVEKFDLSGSRGDANLVLKCKLCNRESSASFDESKPIKPYSIENTNQFAEFATFECRGLEIINFQPREGFFAKGAESNTRFEDIDLTDGEWADYDDKANVEVSIMDIEVKFQRA
ncbi:DUF866-domain-containing protein [Conidiobolus coronatus NRRL 28638]|uniref:DUF866-domain-containing protein n=1 Tax=Conidiobolus coronatus (strain ATCC 28846 / CBS 209.66 / NRRL 28638) TaxID=796925 RepID=A0A137PCK4_CONC2|nr:DUF866-domain-containing protein [Conidiobolus coronatus NRRL 28638]|eukprot:KXN72720.1 DUF866-domain-containing protein [Conidiobolus coronatus NRRL 28638]